MARPNSSSVYFETFTAGNAFLYDHSPLDCLLSPGPVRDTQVHTVGLFILFISSLFPSMLEYLLITCNSFFFL